MVEIRPATMRFITYTLKPPSSSYDWKTVKYSIKVQALSHWLEIFCWPNNWKSLHITLRLTFPLRSNYATVILLPSYMFARCWFPLIFFVKLRKWPIQSVHFCLLNLIINTHSLRCCSLICEVVRSFILSSPEDVYFTHHMSIIQFHWIHFQ